MATRNLCSWDDTPGVAAEDQLETMLQTEQIIQIVLISFKEQNPGDVLLWRNAKIEKMRKRVLQEEQQRTKV